MKDASNNRSAWLSLPVADSTVSMFESLASNEPRVDGVLFFDGSANPNPGDNCQCGYKLHVNTRIIEDSVFIGKGTNNIAEYMGLIEGLKAATIAGVTHLEVYGDSQLVIGGIRKGPWKKGKPHLESLKREAVNLAMHFAHIEYLWIPREQNSDADVLSKSNV